MFFEVLCGGGLVSFALLMALCITLTIYIVRLLLPQERPAFFCDLRVVYCLPPLRVSRGRNSIPVQWRWVFGFCAAVLPWLYQQSFRQGAAISQALLDEGKGDLRQEFCLPREAV